MQRLQGKLNDLRTELDTVLAHAFNGLLYGYCVTHLLCFEQNTD